MTAEGVIALGQQLQATLLQPSRMVEQRTSAPLADPESDDRSQHPGDQRREQHETDVELALARQAARRDQRRIPGPGMPAPMIATSTNRTMYSGRFMARRR